MSIEENVVIPSFDKLEDVEYVLDDGTVVADTQVFKGFVETDDDKEKTRFHFDFIFQDEVVLMGWKLRDTNLASMTFNIKQGCHACSGELCRFDCSRLDKTIIRAKVRNVKKKVVRATPVTAVIATSTPMNLIRDATSTSGALEVAAKLPAKRNTSFSDDSPTHEFDNDLDGNSEEQEGEDGAILTRPDLKDTNKYEGEPSDEEISKWPVDKQEMHRYCRIDVYAERQQSKLKIGDSVASVYSKKVLLSAVVYSVETPREILKRGRPKGSKEKETIFMYLIKWDDVLAYKPDGGAGVWRERNHLTRIQYDFVHRLEVGQGGLAVRYNGSFNVYEDCSIINYDKNRDTYTVKFDDEEVTDDVKRHWIAEYKAELPFLKATEEVVPKAKRAKGRKAKKQKANEVSGEDGVGEDRHDGDDDSGSEEVDDGSDFEGDEDEGSEYGEDTVDDEPSSPLSILRNEWDGVDDSGKKLTVPAKRKIEIQRRETHPALHTLRLANVASNKWAFKNGNALTKDELAVVLSAYDDFLVNVDSLGLHSTDKAPQSSGQVVVSRKRGKQAAALESTQFKYSQKIRLVNIMTDPRHAKLYLTENLQRNRKELDENKTSHKTDFWRCIEAEFAKGSEYTTCTPCCICHPTAYPAGFNANLLFPFDAKKLHSEWSKIINGYSKAFNKINQSGNHEYSCFRDSNASNYAFDDYKVEVLYFSLRTKEMGTDGESFRNACVMALSPEASLDTLEEPSAGDTAPTPAPATDTLKRRLYKSSSKKGPEKGSEVSQQLDPYFTSAIDRLVDAITPKAPAPAAITDASCAVDESYGRRVVQRREEIIDVQDDIKLNKMLGKALKKVRKFIEKHPDCESESSPLHSEYVVLCNSRDSLVRLSEKRKEEQLLL